MGINILLCGDFYPFPEMEYIIKGKTDSEAKLIFGDLLPYIERSDIAALNIEFPLTTQNRGEKKIGPNLKGNPICITPVCEAGFNLAFLSNNHILDFGIEGMNDTITLLEHNGIKHVGCGKNLAEARIPYSDRIIFTGQLDRKSVIEKINSAYCLVLARPDNIQAKYGFPTKLGEYLASGKPVIITKVGDIPLYLTDSINAYLAEPDNIESFSQKLRECLNDPKHAQQIGLEGQKLAYNEFNYLKCVKKMLEQIEERKIISI